MDKELLQKLLKGTSPQDLWNGLKKIEESLEGVEVSVEDLEQLIFDMASEETSEGEKSLPLDEIKEVAISKGLPEPDGDVVRKFMGASFRSFSIEEAETKGAKGKKEIKDYYPSSAELEKINTLTNVDLKAEQVLVFTLVSADENVDRSADQFTTKALKEMAGLSVDKPYLADHSWKTSSVIGKIFDASVSKGRLIQKVYVPVVAKNADMIDGMLYGTHNKVSVGFSMGAEDYVCSSCSKSLYSMDCPHYPGSKDEKGNVTVGTIKGVKDYYEISNVTVPCQPAAGIRRDNQKGLSEPILEEGAVDKISNDKTLGANPLEETNTEPEVQATKEVVEPTVAPVEEVIVPAEKSVEPAAQDVDLKAVIKEAFSEVASELKSLVAELKSTIEAKKEVEKSAVEESTEEIARKLAKTQVTAQPSASDSLIDTSKGGWAASLLSNFKTNQ